ncbi:recombinase family protein [Nocardia tengchongensis]
MNSASAANTWNTSRPPGVVVSRASCRAEREELQRCLEYLRPGDTLVVPALDRLSRSMQDLLAIVAELRKRSLGFQYPYPPIQG